MHNLNQHVFELLGIHEPLLQDGPRNAAFYQALAASVTPGCAVLDIGSGTGLWALTAAKLGAGRVVAIEKDGLMCGVIRRLAEVNGVEDRVTVVEGFAHEVQVEGKFDVVISETIGHMVFDEDVVEIMIDARARFLQPGGVLIPQCVALVAAPVHLADESREAWPQLAESTHVGGYRVSGRESALSGLRYDTFRDLVLHRPLAYLDKSGFQWLGDKTELVSADLRTVKARPEVAKLQAQWNLVDASKLDGVAVWVEMEMTEGVILSTLDTPSWSATVYRVGAFAATAGAMDFTLELLADTNYWTVKIGEEIQRRAPALAVSQMLLESQVGPPVGPAKGAPGEASDAPGGAAS